MEAVLEVNKKDIEKPNIKRAELEYGDMNYIIINLEERVIDIDGIIYEYKKDASLEEKITNMLWEYKNIDEYDYWPDKTNDHPPIKVLWRLSFYDEYETYYHKNGALKYPDKFMDLVELLKRLQSIK